MPKNTAPLTVEYFLDFANVRMWKWAARLSKQGDPNAFGRLTPLRKNLDKIRKVIDPQSTDPESFRKLKQMLMSEFTDELFRHQTLKAIDRYLQTGRKTKAQVDDEKTPSLEPLVEMVEETPSTPKSHKQAVELLKETRSMNGLTAEVAADIYRTLAKTDRKLADAFAKDMRASFKGAVPGNLADNTKPSTPASQKHAVELLKQGGILPAGEKASDYPVLTADVKREIIATLLKQKEPKLATWASRLPAEVTAFKEEELFLWNVRSHKPSYRKSEWDRLKAGKKVTRSFDEVAVDLVKKGLFKRSKSGSLLLTPQGKQATMSLPSALGPGRYVASFKGAVPGNLADNTKPSTPASQKQAVELLKQGGILPEGEKTSDYPVLTADVKREIIATLLRRKQRKLATWASRNLVVAYPPPKTKKPSLKTMKRWIYDGIAEATDGCQVEPDGVCPHGHPSWLVRLGLI